MVGAPHPERVEFALQLVVVHDITLIIVSREVPHYDILSDIHCSILVQVQHLGSGLVNRCIYDVETVELNCRVEL